MCVCVCVYEYVCMRHVTEGIKIENMEVGRIMNERMEWNMTRVNKVNVDVN